MLLNHLNEHENILEGIEDQNIYIEEQNKLLALYVVNLRNKVVTAERNPAIYLIATKHLELLKQTIKVNGKVGMESGTLNF